ncbi:hypothetical protein CFP56_005959 [Quercus suber]|uniref:Uncharacterized protein n=1 Tax=Quercus suber TaxID=58331 RepID=A0AAW0M7X0_QUESU
MTYVILDVIVIVPAGGEGSLTPQGWWRGITYTTRDLVYSTATIVVRNVYASPPARTGARRNVHATTIGKLRKADPSAHDEPNKR